MEQQPPLPFTNSYGGQNDTHPFQGFHLRRDGNYYAIGHHNHLNQIPMTHQRFVSVINHPHVQELRQEITELKKKKDALQQQLNDLRNRYRGLEVIHNRMVNENRHRNLTEPFNRSNLNNSQTAHAPPQYPVVPSTAVRRNDYWAPGGVSPVAIRTHPQATGPNGTSMAPMAYCPVNHTHNAFTGPMAAPQVDHTAGPSMERAYAPINHTNGVTMESAYPPINHANRVSMEPAYAPVNRTNRVSMESAYPPIDHANGASIKPAYAPVNKTNGASMSPAACNPVDQTNGASMSPAACNPVDQTNDASNSPAACNPVDQTNDASNSPAACNPVVKTNDASNSPAACNPVDQTNDTSNSPAACNPIDRHTASSASTQTNNSCSQPSPPLPHPASSEPNNIAASAVADQSEHEEQDPVDEAGNFADTYFFAETGQESSGVGQVLEQELFNLLNTFNSS